MNAISKKIVTKFDDGKLFPPLVPLVGGGYQSTRLMIYGMAQNFNDDWIDMSYKRNFSRK